MRKCCNWGHNLRDAIFKSETLLNQTPACTKSAANVVILITNRVQIIVNPRLFSLSKEGLRPPLKQSWSERCACGACEIPAAARVFGKGGVVACTRFCRPRSKSCLRRSPSPHCSCRTSANYNFFNQKKGTPSSCRLVWSSGSSILRTSIYGVLQLTSPTSNLSRFYDHSVPRAGF